ncbi:hypothetical protein [Streptococcus loxodontisalivarius]|uniref:DUF443 family protein n=1 Tax=Streptococcus loxodontisalivarius TaxID=1349415 RepID=A0ABS2PUD0_9STRE|nr:hypothetical protein [Streptococcus loxodontisalivarius]MBM7643649.1 hypothetical protein [Streptococcus loxodontisalivarius]
MKIKLGDYFVVGGFGQKSVFIKKDYTLPYYVGKEEVETKTSFTIPAGMTFLATVLIRSIDTKNLQANLLLLLAGCFIIYFSIEWYFRGYNSTEYEVEEYQFKTEEDFFAFLQDSKRRNKVIMRFYLVFALILVVSAFLYFSTNLVIFLFATFVMFFCLALLTKYHPFQRMFILRKLKRELIQ